MLRRTCWVIVVILSLLMLTAQLIEAGPSERVTFVTSDNVGLTGYLWGQGEVGVILSHMYPADQRSWFKFAQLLAKKGYLVLTFDFRGYGESGGTKRISLIDRDLEAAYDFLASRAKKIFLIGASMGGTASLKVAARREVAGVISLSGPDHFRGLDARGEVKKIKAPKLFIATKGDIYAHGAAQRLYQSATSPKDILLLGGSEHGTNMLQGTRASEVREAILDFLARYR